jgi:hypothetical protein
MVFAEQAQPYIGGLQALDLMQKDSRCTMVTAAEA